MLLMPVIPKALPTLALALGWGLLGMLVVSQITAMSRLNTALACGAGAILTLMTAYLWEQRASHVADDRARKALRKAMIVGDADRAASSSV